MARWGVETTSCSRLVGIEETMKDLSMPCAHVSGSGRDQNVTRDIVTRFLAVALIFQNDKTRHTTCVPEKASPSAACVGFLLCRPRGIKRTVCGLWTPSIHPSHQAGKMATRPRKAKVSLINDRIGILNRNAVETSPAKQVFGTVITIITLVRVGTRSASIREHSLMSRPGQDD